MIEIITKKLTQDFLDNGGKILVCPTMKCQGYTGYLPKGIKKKTVKRKKKVIQNILDPNFDYKDFCQNCKDNESCQTLCKIAETYINQEVIEVVFEEKLMNTNHLKSGVKNIMNVIDTKSEFARKYRLTLAEMGKDIDIQINKHQKRFIKKYDLTKLQYEYLTTLLFEDITQQELADKLGKSQGSISRVVTRAEDKIRKYYKERGRKIR